MTVFYIGMIAFVQIISLQY